MKEMKFLFRQIQRMRNILAILALFVCTSICLGELITIPEGTDIHCYNRNGELLYHNIAGNSRGRNGILNGSRLTDPKGSTVTIKTRSKVGNVFGAYMDRANLNEHHPSMTNNTVIVRGKDLGTQSSNFYGGGIAGAFATDDITALNVSMNVSSNSVIIMGGDNIGYVYGGRAVKGTVSSNTVTIGGVEVVIIGGNVFGGAAFDGIISSNTVIITTGTTVNLDVYGGWVRNGDAIDNRVTLISGTVRQDIFGGCVIITEML